MIIKKTTTGIALRIWLYTSICFSIAWLAYGIVRADKLMLAFPVAGIAACIGSLPVFVLLVIIIPYIAKQQKTIADKVYMVYGFCFLMTIPYGIIVGLICWAEFHNSLSAAVTGLFTASFCLFTCCAISLLLIHNKLNQYFLTIQTSTRMEQNEFPQPNTAANTGWQPKSANTSGNKTLIKGVITGALILLLLVPTVFVSDLVTEREKRQQEVVKDVTSGWASPQTVSGPFICIPYTTGEKETTATRQLFIMPENLDVDGNITPELRQRSIYNVLLYRSNVKASGNFKFDIPKQIPVENLKLQDAKICFTLTDIRGIEERLNIQLNNASYELLPGLPYKETESMPVPENTTPTETTRASTATLQRDVVGLSSPVNLSVEDLQKSVSFSVDLKLKGSQSLHFLPLSGSSNFNIKSVWKDPKFDGGTLPSTRDVGDSGFTAKWSFNKSNLPFNNITTDFSFNKQSLAFGVSMLQPTDQYAKTLRSVKYAILFIGLTFALFFIIELMQKKPMHPVQYVLIGIALVIFFTLLLSISEFLNFDIAYLIAAAATVLLITAYAKTHFKSIKTAAVFGCFLSFLYAFIFVLISLEDAALLVGSIGLFVILALVMFGSRKINWYGNES